MKAAWQAGLWFLLFAFAAGCMRPAEERARLDRLVGIGEAGGVGVTVQDGLASIRTLEPGHLEIWAQAPSVVLDLDTSAAEAWDWTITARNCMPRAELTAVASDGTSVQANLEQHPIATVKTWQLTLPESGARLEITPPDAGEPDAWRFGVLSDIQEGVHQVQDIFDRIDEEPGVRFVVSTGDLAEQGERWELERIQTELRSLGVPFFSTVGNHEMFAGNPHIWHELFGRHSFRFDFKGVRFLMIDSANATVDPLVYDLLEGWMGGAGERHQVFVTHKPPLDPSGERNGAFGSRKEAAKLLTRLATGGVDLCLYGHIHSYYVFSNAGIPAYISGGGGAIEERMDGIDRHFLVVEADPDGGVDQIRMVRID